jgi:ADP-ribosylglycohydrolase
LLAGTYFAIVLALEPAFGSLTHGSELAVGCSTLAVAWLFRPVRARVQEAVDRRFYRSKTDTEQTLAHFGARLQREADVETLIAELDHVVREALQPALVTVWLRNDPETVT